MKIFALILSFYVIALTAIPCSDVGAAEIESNSIENIQQSQDHSSEVELCSPFCFCNCCQTLDQPAIQSVLQVDVVTNKISISNLVQNEKVFIISIWHPPKFV